MTEERRHGKPIGKPADHRGFHRRADDADPRVVHLERARDDEQHRRADKQQRRAALHLVELRLARGLVVQNLHRARTGRSGCGSGFARRR